MTGVGKEDAEALLKEVTEMLNGSGRTVLYFKSGDLYEDPIRARMVSTVLVNHVKKNGNRLGRYFIFKDCRRSARNGIRWKAVKIEDDTEIQIGMLTVLRNASPVAQL